MFDDELCKHAGPDQEETGWDGRYAAKNQVYRSTEIVKKSRYAAKIQLIMLCFIWICNSSLTIFPWLVVKSNFTSKLSPVRHSLWLIASGGVERDLCWDLAFNLCA